MAQFLSDNQPELKAGMQVDVHPDAAGNLPTILVGSGTNQGLQLTPSGTAVVLLGDTSTGTIVSGAVTINAQRGVITTGAAISSAGTTTAYSFQLVNNKIYATSILTLQVVGYTGAGIGLTPAKVTLGQGSATITLMNLAHSAAATGSATINFAVLN